MIQSFVREGASSIDMDMIRTEGEEKQFYTSLLPFIIVVDHPPEGFPDTGPSAATDVAPTTNSASERISILALAGVKA